MGAWGPAIFSDDLACDIRSDYRELLEDQMPDQEASERIIAAYRKLGPDEEHVLWLALAASQSAVGRLDDEVKRRALELIDAGRGLDLWEEAGPKELAKRKAALAKLRDQLTGEQPARKTIRRPWRYVTDLEPGDVLTYQVADDHVAVLRVARLDDHRLNVAPIVECLEWQDSGTPTPAEIARLNVAVLQRPFPMTAVFRVAKHRKREPDWQECGFEVLAKGIRRPDDEDAKATSHVAWPGLRVILERGMTQQAPTT